MTKAANFITKVAKIFGDILAVLKMTTFIENGSFWATFGKIWTTFYYHIWSDKSKDENEQKKAVIFLEKTCTLKVIFWAKTLFVI